MAVFRSEEPALKQSRVELQQQAVANEQLAALEAELEQLEPETLQEIALACVAALIKIALACVAAVITNLFINGELMKITISTVQYR